MVTRLTDDVVDTRVKNVTAAHAAGIKLTNIEPFDLLSPATVVRKHDVVDDLPIVRGLSGRRPGDLALNIRQKAQLFSNVSRDVTELRQRVQSKLKERRTGGNKPAVPGIAPVPKLQAKALTAEASAVSAPAKKVSFTPFTVKLWSKADGGIVDLSAVNGGLKDLTIPVGKYILTFDVANNETAPFVEVRQEVPFEAAGKQCVLEKAAVTPEADGKSSTLRVQIRVVQNPIPLLIMIPFIASTIGGMAWLTGDALKEADRVIVDIADKGVSAAVILLGCYIGYKLIKGRS